MPDEKALPDSSAVQQQLARVLSSRTFAKSPRVCVLLEFIVTRSTAAQYQELTEQQIGIQVFGRPPGYNSSEDTIVRGAARQLRQRLDLYYADEGVSDEVQIAVPKGGYVAIFEKTATNQTPLPAFPPSVPIAVGKDARPSTAKPWKVAVAALSLAVIGLTFYAVKPHDHLGQQELIGPQLLWNTLFTPGQKTIIVPGDGSLHAFIAWEQRPVSLADYTTQKYQQEAKLSLPPNRKSVSLGMRSVTPMADLSLVSLLSRLPMHMGQPQEESWMDVRYARDLIVGETHNNNLILIGSDTFNPWVQLYQPEMDFITHWDLVTDDFTILNKLPHPGEPSSYQYVENHAFTHIALLNNSQGQGRVLIIEGTSMGTTYGAINFLTQQSLWGPVIRMATDSAGHLHNFEVILSEDFLHGGVGNTRVVSMHLHS